MDYSDIRYAVAYDRPADGPDDHSVDLLRGAPDETDGDDWYPLDAKGDGVEAADEALAAAGLQRTTPWAQDDDLAGLPGWYARVRAAEYEQATDEDHEWVVASHGGGTTWYACKECGAEASRDSGVYD